MAISSESLKTFLADDLGVDDPVEDATLLFSTSVIDSFQMMSLIEFIEKSCGFRIPPDDVTFENLDSIQRILAYAARRGKG